jgi:glycosyltransferase involved in cell wall biosynthesis
VIALHCPESKSSRGSDVAEDRQTAEINILHATDRHDRVKAGIALAVNEIIAQTSAVLPPNSSEFLASVAGVDIDVPPGVRHVSSKSSLSLSGPWRYAPGYGRLCERIIHDHDINVVHLHGAWTYPIFAAHRAAQSQGIPTVLTNHGQFTPWAISQPNMFGALRKRLYLALMTGPLFHRITLLHAITPLDRAALHYLFPRSRIEIIPNSIDLAVLDKYADCMDSAPSAGPYVLFVGRLHPVKGLDLLVEGFGRADLPRDWRLILVGPEDDAKYAKRLRRAIASSPRANRIELRKPVWNPVEKYLLMRGAWITAVGSHTEVVSLVNLEASACGTPTITTRATGLFDWEEGGGLLMEPTVPSIAAALSTAGRWSQAEREQRGRASRKLVERRYSTKATAPQWLELYRSLG